MEKRKRGRPKRDKVDELRARAWAHVAWEHFRDGVFPVWSRTVHPDDLPKRARPTRTAFREFLGITQPHEHYLRHGKCSPSRRLVQRIERAPDGRLWCPLPPDDAPSAVYHDGPMGIHLWHILRGKFWDRPHVIRRWPGGKEETIRIQHSPVGIHLGDPLGEALREFCTRVYNYHCLLRAPDNFPAYFLQMIEYGLRAEIVKAGGEVDRADLRDLDHYERAVMLFRVECEIVFQGQPAALLEERYGFSLADLIDAAVEQFSTRFRRRR